MSSAVSRRIAVTLSVWRMAKSIHTGHLVRDTSPFVKKSCTSFVFRGGLVFLGHNVSVSLVLVDALEDFCCANLHS
jgi:hypothetical protein